ncbi:hypothetical protein B0H10DRAFT_2202335 [Mycena sp. CBHHK59/15]|nr:hypothetical protein B0H10DRAFT_2202335 [Mycena sp. CBHHK59/15]
MILYSSGASFAALQWSTQPPAAPQPGASADSLALREPSLPPGQSFGRKAFCDVFSRGNCSGSRRWPIRRRRLLAQKTSIMIATRKPTEVTEPATAAVRTPFLQPPVRECICVSYPHHLCDFCDGFGDALGLAEATPLAVLLEPVVATAVSPMEVVDAEDKPCKEESLMLVGATRAPATVKWFKMGGQHTRGLRRAGVGKLDQILFKEQPDLPTDRPTPGRLTLQQTSIPPSLSGWVHLGTPPRHFMLH